jgi:hypothetical protein
VSDTYHYSSPYFQPGSGLECTTGCRGKGTYGGIGVTSQRLGALLAPPIDGPLRAGLPHRPEAGPVVVTLLTVTPSDLRDTPDCVVWRATIPENRMYYRL